MAPPVEGSLWYYAPNKGAPIAFAILFLISGILHSYQTHIYKSWRFTVLFPWACTVFVAGFVLREIGAFNYDKINIFIASTVMLYCAPPIYAGANYFILARTLYYAPYASPMHPGRIASTFIGIDVLIEILTGNGASRFANSEATPTDIKVGESLIRASLLMQLILQIIFTFVIFKFHQKFRSTGVISHKVNMVVYTLYASSSLIIARSIFRSVENFSVTVHPGKYPSGELVEHEVWFYVFEASILLVNTYFMNFMHPGRFLPRSNKTYLARDGSTELEGPGWVDKRPFLATLFDPCDIVGLIRGKDKQNRFWEEDEFRLQQQRSEEAAVH